MFWTESKRVALFSIFFSTLFIFGCTSESDNEHAKESEEKTLTEEEQIIRQVENKLGITAAEKYDIQILYKYINPDTLQDALILVNRKSHAIQRSENNKTEKFFENTGFTAPHNHLFVKLGGEKNVISTAAVGSNVKYPLQVEFIELTSKAHQDFYVEYRIRNSMHRNYYTVRNNNLYLTFSCPVFDNIGEEIPKVYDIQHPTSPVRIAKDIALYHGRLVDYNPANIEDVNDYTPKEIIGTGKLFVYFVFDDKAMKYVTPMKGVEE